MQHQREKNGQTMRLLRQFKHGNGNDYRRVPPSWQFPRLALQGMYSYWHCGDEVNNIPPMKFLERRDLKHLGRRAPSTYWEIQQVVTLIDDCAKAKGLQVRDTMSHTVVNSLYANSKAAIAELVPAQTKSGRKRNITRLKYPTVIREILKKRKQDNSTNNK